MDTIEDNIFFKDIFLKLNLIHIKKKDKSVNEKKKEIRLFMQEEKEK